MAEVKWIKITTSMFEDEKIDYIESLPEADAILIVWIKLLTLAGKCNAGGYVFLTETIPYTEEMLAHKFRRPPNTVKLALATLERLEMIDWNNGNLYVCNWEKHQNIEGMERIKNQNKIRARKYRKRLKRIGGYDYLNHHGTLMKRDNGKCVYCGGDDELCIDHIIPVAKGGDNEIDNLAIACKSCNSGKAGRLPEEAGYQFFNKDTEKLYQKTLQRLEVNITHNVTRDIRTNHATEEDQEEDIDIDIDIDPKPESVPYDEIVSEYHNNCPSLPKVRFITDKRKREIRTRWKRYNDISTFSEVFRKAEASNFLSGRNGKWTACNFDWLLKEANMIKTLEGNYDNKGGDINGPTSGSPAAGYGQGSSKSEYAGCIR